uniref:Pentatricopeptide repeat-containing protein At5g06540 family n=2 Tax=Cajanus cajan TaxID=3821 RepID=A0A151TVZ2_CAJCA|nr:Pentatricopeptide repeat-containing protein At5g06540 family [Cajanus cajan]
MERCSNVWDLKLIHAYMLRTHLFFDLFAVSRLVAFCVHSSNLLHYAIKLVSQIQSPNLFIYNALIRGCSTTQNPENSFHYYIKALRFGLLPDNITHPFLVKACAQLESSAMGMQVHGHIIKHGFEHDCYVRNSLVHMYATVGDIKAARSIFRRMRLLNICIY